jgi:amino acid transporter
MISSSRVVLDMAGESKMFRIFSYISPRFKTPVAALVLAGTLMAAFSLIGNITTVALISNLFIYITFFAVNIEVMILRKTKPQMERPFKIRGTAGGIPVIAVAAVIMILIMLGYNIYALVAYPETAV